MAVKQYTRRPIVAIVYQNKDITGDVFPYLVGLTYTDKIDSDSPDIDIALEDSQKLWQADWFPSNQDKIAITFQYENSDELLDAGTFEVDDLAFDFSQQGDGLRLGAQATPLSKDLREKRSKEYENVTLQTIVNEIAERQKLTVQGAIVEVTFERLTQNEESDLVFLARLAKDFGQLFKIEGANLIFYNWSDLDGQEPLFTLTRADIASFRVRKKLTGTYKSAKLTYSKGEDEEEIEVIIEAETPVDSEDVLILNERSEDGKQAELKAREKLRAANADEYSGSIALEGEPRYIAGINFTLEGFGAFDGIWQIQKASHSFSQQGWATGLDVRRIRGAETARLKNQKEN